MRIWSTYISYVSTTQTASALMKAVPPTLPNVYPLSIISSSVLKGSVGMLTVRKAIRFPLYVATTTMQYIHQKPTTNRPDCAVGR